MDRVAGLTPLLHTTIPAINLTVAIPVTPPDGAEEMATVGPPRYPPPLLDSSMYLIPPVTIPVTAVAVTPTPTKVRV